MNIDVVLRVGAMSETVQVMGETPLLDTTKAVQAVNVSGS